MEITINNYYEKRESLFKWRSNTSFLNKTILAFLVACITGIMAQIIIPLPWTPVPVTAQTFAVLMAGIILGRYWGGVSMAIYLLVGLIGVPWFSGMNGGIDVLFSANAGYLLGFILAAFFLGHFTDKYIESRKFIPMLALMLFASFVLIYIPGLIFLAVWSQNVTGASVGIWQLLLMGAVPFIVGDLFKIGGAAALTKAITPKIGEEL
jgi:biotin transport system substrate-specific component